MLYDTTKYKHCLSHINSNGMLEMPGTTQHWLLPFNGTNLYTARICMWLHGIWWRHQMETFSALLAICAGNSPVPGELWCFLYSAINNKRLSKLIVRLVILDAIVPIMTSVHGIVANELGISASNINNRSDKYSPISCDFEILWWGVRLLNE